MLALRGKYHNGKIQLEENIESDKEIDVIVTFLEESSTKESRKKSLLEKLKYGPVMSDEQYQDYLQSRLTWQRNASKDGSH